MAQVGRRSGLCRVAGHPLPTAVHKPLIRVSYLWSPMRIRVLLFGQLKDIVGQPEQSLDLQPGADLASVVTHYAETFPRFKPFSSTIACSINQEYATATSILREADGVGLLP